MMPLEEIKAQSKSSSSTEKLEVTIIPVDEEAYSKTINMPMSSVIGKFIIILLSSFKIKARLQHRLGPRLYVGPVIYKAHQFYIVLMLHLVHNSNIQVLKTSS